MVVIQISFMGNKYNHMVVYVSGLLSTPNLIPLPQQNQGSLLAGPPRLSLQAQVHRLMKDPYIWEVNICQRAHKQVPRGFCKDISSCYKPE